MTIHATTELTGEAQLAQDIASRLGTYIKSAEQALIAEKTKALRPFELTVPQYAAMMMLYYVPGQSAAQLARSVAVTPQTMATILANLEAKRLVRRETSPLHTKVQVTTLTSAGEALVLRADEVARAVERRLTDEFTVSEADELRSLLDRAISALRPAHG